MSEALFYLVSSFWLGAVHAATPGHGKTISAAYIVGARGRPVDALILGIFVTLSHTSGIVLVAVLASLGLPGLIPQRVETYLALFTGILVIVMGVWMLWIHEHDHLPAHDHDHEHNHDHNHEEDPLAADLSHYHEQEGEGVYHSHGWGIRHTHRIDVVTQNRPSLLILLGLGISGGLLPDPAALAILLSALASGKVMLGLGMVLVFSLGFASTLVIVGIVAAKVGQSILTWLSGPWAQRIQLGTALLVIVVGIILTVNAWRTVSTLL
ncbi:MAG: sulfite exporter TauE/SafE family protein [Nitrospira sp.]|nr:sulfite exporter TauE/SafE family protein [Nitrospira sp.]